MRRIVAFNWMTEDGYFAASDGSLDWVVPDEEQTKAAAEDIQNVDTALFGRRTYGIFEEFWSPMVADASGTVPDPHNPGRRSRGYAAIATALNTMKKVVFSRTLRAATWKNSHVIRDLDPGQIEVMKREPGRDMMIFGSSSITSLLSQHGLIDEYQYVVCPVLLGNGQSLLRGMSRRLRLGLAQVRQLPSGDVMLKYSRQSG